MTAEPVSARSRRRRPAKPAPPNRRSAAGPTLPATLHRLVWESPRSPTADLVAVAGELHGTHNIRTRAWVALANLERRGAIRGVKRHELVEMPNGQAGLQPVVRWLALTPPPAYDV